MPKHTSLILAALAHLLILTPALVNGYCWEPGKNPSFTGTPIAEQVDIKTVRISWFGLVSSRECTDQFLVKYWPRNNPQAYEMSEMAPNTANHIDVKVTPKLDYQFQAVAREDKGYMIGIDYNKSPVTDFRTSLHNKEVAPSLPPQQQENVENGKSQVMAAPSTISQRINEEEATVLTVELIAIIIVCGVVLLLVVVGVIYKFTCGKSSHVDEDDEDTESAKPEKEPLKSDASSTS